MKPRGESAFWIMAAGLLWPSMALAEEATQAPSAGYSSTDYVWFFFIAVVLAYGVYDTFFKTP